MIRPTRSLESLLIDSLPSFSLPVACLTSSPFSRGRHYITYVACCERSLKNICINCCREFQFTQSFPSLSWIYFKPLRDKYIFSAILKNIIKHLVVNTTRSCANTFNVLLYLIWLCYFYDIIIALSRRYMIQHKFVLCVCYESTLQIFQQFLFSRVILRSQ